MHNAAKATSNHRIQRTPVGSMAAANRSDKTEASASRRRFGIDSSAAIVGMLVVTLVAWVVSMQPLRAERPMFGDAQKANDASQGEPADRAKLVVSIGEPNRRAVDAAFRIGPADGDAKTSAFGNASSHVLVAHEAAMGGSPFRSWAPGPADNVGPPAAPYAAAAPPPYQAAAQQSFAGPPPAERPPFDRAMYGPGPQPPVDYAPAARSTVARASVEPNGHGVPAFPAPMVAAPAADEDLRAPARPPVKEETGERPWFAAAEGQANTALQVAPRAVAPPTGRMPPPNLRGTNPGPVASTSDLPPLVRGPVGTLPPPQAYPREFAPPPRGASREMAPMAAGDAASRPTGGVAGQSARETDLRVAHRGWPTPENVEPPRPGARSVFTPNVPVYAPPPQGSPGQFAAGSPAERRIAQPPYVQPNNGRKPVAPPFDQMFRDGGSATRPYAPPPAPSDFAAQGAWPTAAAPPVSRPTDPRDAVIQPAEPRYPETPYAAAPSPDMFAGPRSASHAAEQPRTAAAADRPVFTAAFTPMRRHPTMAEPVSAATVPGPEREQGGDVAATASDHARFTDETPHAMRVGAMDSPAAARNAVWAPQRAPIASIVARSHVGAGADAATVVPGPVAENSRPFRVAIDSGRAQMVAEHSPQIGFVDRDRLPADVRRGEPAAALPELSSSVASAAHERDDTSAEAEPPEPEGEAVIASDDPPPDAVGAPPREAAQAHGPALGDAARGFPFPPQRDTPTADRYAAPPSYSPSYNLPASSRRDARAGQAPLGYPVMPPSGFIPQPSSFEPQSPTTARGTNHLDPPWRR